MPKQLLSAVWDGLRTPESFLAVILCGALLSAGCSGQMAASNGSSPPGGGPAPSPAASVTLCDNQTPGCPPASTFTLSTLRGIDISVAWSNLRAGAHTQKLSLRLPNGDLYQSLESGFLISDFSAGSTTTIRTLPVAGTFITQRQLIGDWTLEVSLDEQPLASLVVHFDP